MSQPLAEKNFLLLRRLASPKIFATSEVSKVKKNFPADNLPTGKNFRIS
ncbi:MAG: hypothetical protein IJP91_02390 [Synergistaceae bacterium]|nr:hypothetical protein [Synergistaceae bacterium]